MEKHVDPEFKDFLSPPVHVSLRNRSVPRGPIGAPSEALVCPDLVEVERVEAGFFIY